MSWTVDDTEKLLWNTHGKSRSSFQTRQRLHTAPLLETTLRRQFWFAREHACLGNRAYRQTYQWILRGNKDNLFRISNCELYTELQIDNITRNPTGLFSVRTVCCHWERGTKSHLSKAGTYKSMPSSEQLTTTVILRRLRTFGAIVMVEAAPRGNGVYKWSLVTHEQRASFCRI